MFSKRVATITVVFGLFTFSLSFDYTGGDELYEDDPCTMGDGSAGTCTVSGKCDWFVTNVIQKRIVPYRSVTRCGFNRNDEIVCCPPTRVGPRISRKSTQACEHFRDSTKLSFLIVGGEEAEEGDVPFIAVLGYEPSGSDQYDWGCGSSLISPRFLLTAAHCIRQARRPIIARMGILNLVKPDLDNMQESTLKRFIPHPDYKPPSKYNDIALIEVDKPFKYDDYVNAACLYTGMDDLPPSQVLIASGWGLTGADESRSDVLLKVNLTTEPLKNCDQEYRTQLGGQTSKLVNGVIPSQYCTIGSEIKDGGKSSGKRRDSCTGDSGGPLHYLDEAVSRFFLVGVTSFGLGCGETASICTRVAAYLDWIEPIVWPDSASLLGGAS